MKSRCPRCRIAEKHKNLAYCLPCYNGWRKENGKMNYKKRKPEKPTIYVQRAMDQAAMAGAETVEQFIARGGAIKHVPHGATGTKQ